MLFNRSFYFFQVKIVSKFFSKLNFFHNFDFLKISKISINFFFPKIEYKQDLRLVTSFFLLFKIFTFKPHIFYLKKFIYEDESKKQMQYRFISNITLIGLYKFLFFDFLFDNILIQYNKIFISYKSFFFTPSKFVCIFKQTNFFPNIDDKYYLTNSILCLSFCFNMMQYYFFENFFNHIYIYINAPFFKFIDKK